MDFDERFEHVRGFVNNYNPIFDYDKDADDRLSLLCDALEIVFGDERDNIVATKVNREPDLFYQGLVQLVMKSIKIEGEKLDYFVEAVSLADSVAFYAVEDDIVALDFFVNEIWKLKGGVRK